MPPLRRGEAENERQAAGELVEAPGTRRPVPLGSHDLPRPQPAELRGGKPRVRDVVFYENINYGRTYGLLPALGGGIGPPRWRGDGEPLRRFEKWYTHVGSSPRF